MTLDSKNVEVERPSPDQRIDATLARLRQEFAQGDFGSRITKAEEEEILGFGPDGV